jgi:signal peptidase I
MRIGRSKEKSKKTRKRRKSWYRELIEVIVISGTLALFLRTFVIQAFRIPSGSMEDTLLVGDFLLVNKFLYGAKVPFTDYRLPGLRDPVKGDIIVFSSPRDNPGHSKVDYIKRCVAVEGDTVQLVNNVLYINGDKADDSHKVLKGLPRASPNFGPYVVPEGHVFMMGDNRNNSDDSRVWGPLDMDKIKGKAIVLYWSWDSRKHLPRLGRIGKLIR